MRLSDAFAPNEVIRDAEFDKTMYPATREPRSICYTTSARYLQRALQNPNIVALITNAELADRVDAGRGLAVVENPQLTYYALHNRMARAGMMRLHTEHSIHPTAQIAPTATIGHPVVIGAHVTVGHYAHIGDYTILGEETEVGEHALIGVKGLQNPRIDGKRYPIEFAGGVKVGAGCQVLAGAMLERPYQAFYTAVGDGSSISVYVIVGHGSQIGRNVMVAGSALIAGNVTIGDNVWIGPLALISDTLTIGDNAQIKLGSVVIHDVAAGESVSGNFALPHPDQMSRYRAARGGRI